MSKYSSEFKENAIKQLLPPISFSLREVAKKEGIPQTTLYTWLQKRKREGASIMPTSKAKSADNWSSEQKLAAVVQTYAMNSEELNTYCRSQGLYLEQIQAWKKACLLGYATDEKNSHQEAEKLRLSNKKIKSLEQELHRKEKALAEAAALLTLGKKFDALWADKEGS